MFFGGGHPYDPVKPWENMKTHPPRCPKNTFPEQSGLIPNGLNGVNVNSLIVTLLSIFMQHI